MKRAWAAVAVGIAILVALWLRADRDAMTPASDGKLAHAPAAARTDPRAASTTVVGRVTNQLDGAGLAGATVSLRSLAHARLDPQAIVAIADADGAWSATVAPGKYAVSASADGFLPGFAEEMLTAGKRIDLALVAGGGTLGGVVTDLGGGPVADAQILAYVGGAAVVAVSRADGHYRMTLPEGTAQTFVRHEAYTPLTCAALIGATPATCDFALVPGGTIRGQVVAEDTGKPVGGALVEAWGMAMLATSASTISEPDGTFFLDEIGPGAIRLTASARGFTSGVPTFVDHLMGEQVDHARVVVQRTFTLAGRVEDAGRGVAGVGLVAIEEAHRTQMVGAQEATDASGAFEIFGLRPGSYEVSGSLGERRVTAVTVTVADRDLTAIVARLGPAPALGFDVGGHVEPRAVATVELDGSATTTDARGAFVFHDVPAGKHQLRATTRDDRVGGSQVAITGARADLTLTLAAAVTVTGKVVDDTGRPVATVRVKASGPDERTSSRQALSDSDGKFRITRLPAGKLQVTAQVDGGLEVPDDQATTVDLELVAGETRTDVTVTVPARVRTLRGQVVDADGAPVAEAWVKAISPYDDLPAVATTHDGAFVFEHLRRGTRYRLSAVSPRGDARGAEVAGADDRVVIKLLPLGAIAVRVTQGGIPVRAYALDCAASTDEALHVRTRDGTFVIDHLALGHHHCAATTADGTGAGDVEVAAGVAHLELEIPRATRVTGTVIDAITGAPLAGIVVWARDGGRNGGASDASGRFAMDDVPTSGVLWFSRQGGYASLGSARFSVADGHETELGAIRIASTSARGGDLGLGIGYDDALVAYVAHDGPAARAGLKQDDEIVTIDGAPLAGMAHGAPYAILSGLAVGKTVQLGLARGVTVAVTAVLP